MCQTCTPETPAPEIKPIEMGKSYRYRNGEPARVLCVDRPDKFGYVVISIASDGCIHTHNKKGELASGGTPCGFDLLEVSPYDDFKPGEPVMVRTAGSLWLRRHFHSVQAGIPRTIQGGESLWTGAKGDATSWNFCRRPTPEELAAQGL